LNITQHVFIIVASCVALGVGASWLVDAAARIAKWFGISQLVIGLLLLAVTVGLLVMLGDHELSRFEGSGLFVVLIGYLVYLF